MVVSDHKPATRRSLVETSLVIGSLFFISAFVFVGVPQFAAMFNDMGTDLPAATKALLAFARNPLLVFLPPTVLSLLMIRCMRRPSSFGSVVVAGALAYSVVTVVVTLVALILPLIKIIGPDVHFVLPQGYRGAFVLRASQQGSSWSRVPPRRRASGSRFQYVVTVPASGVLVFDTLEPLDPAVGEGWFELEISHYESASYADGTAIPDELISNAMNTADDGVIRFYKWRTESGGDTWYLIGTRSDIQKAYPQTRLTPGARPR